MCLLPDPKNGQLANTSLCIHVVCMCVYSYKHLYLFLHLSIHIEIYQFLPMPQFLIQHYILVFSLSLFLTSYFDRCLGYFVE